MGKLYRAARPGLPFRRAASNDQADYGSGLLITGEARATVRSCHAENNEFGIEVAGTATAELEQNVCINNVLGILYGADSMGAARENFCTDCETGIVVIGAASPELVRNHCERNAIGIHFDEYASGVARANRCLEIQQGGIHVEGETSSVLEGNDCLLEVR